MPSEPCEASWDAVNHTFGGLRGAGGSRRALRASMGPARLQIPHKVPKLHTPKRLPTPAIIYEKSVSSHKIAQKSIFYRFWTLPICRKRWPCHAFFMFSTLRKSLQFSWFLASENRLWTAKNLTFSTLRFDAVPVFVDAFSFSKMQIRTAGVGLLWGSFSLCFDAFSILSCFVLFILWCLLLFKVF